MDKFTEEMMRKVASDLAMDEGTVRKVVNFQFKDMLRAARTARHIEMTWFGKWYASAGKCRRHINRLTDLVEKIEAKMNREEDMSEARISSFNAKLRAMRETIEFLRSKMDYEVRYKGAVGGDVEQYICEAGSGDDIQAETEPM